MNIGIIVTPFIEEEFKKKEIININELNSIEKNCYNNISSKYKLNNKSNIYVSSDIMIINYLKCTYKNININILNPLTLTEEQLKINDLNFILTFDVIEAFHTLPLKMYQNYKNIIYSVSNIYPSIDFQKFIAYKSIYYSYLKEKNINVQDFYVIYNNSDYIKNLQKFLKYKDQNNWENYVLKPLYGQESIGVSFIDKNTNNFILQQKIEKFFNSFYPGILFQKEIKIKFKNGKLKEEYRIFFIGGEYIYMTSEIWRSRINTDLIKAKIKNTYKIKPNEEINKAISFSKNIIKILPKIEINNIKLKYLLIRIDVTYDNNDKLVVSEIECVPSLFIELFEDIKSLNGHQLLGDNIVEITKDYLHKKMINNIIYDKKEYYYNKLYIFLFFMILLLFTYCFLMSNSRK